MATSVVHHQGTLRPLLVLALPVLAEQLLGMLVGISDTVLAGQYLSQSHLAAMGSISYLLWLLTNLFVAIDVGATALVARHVGAGEVEGARHVTNQSLLVGSAVSILATAVVYPFAPVMVRLLKLDPEPAALAVRYLQFLLPIVPALMIESVGIACLRGAGDMVTGLWAMIAVNVVNVALAWGLILGIGPLPKLGWDGIAIGTAVGHVVGAAWIAVALLMGRAGLKIEPFQWRPNWNTIARLLRIGLPGGADMLSVIFLHLVFLSLVNGLGETAAAAHAVGIRIESLSYLPGAAFQLAAATMAGQFLGARDFRRASSSVWTACLAAEVLMVTAALAFFFLPGPLAYAFIGHDKPEVAEQVIRLLRIVAISEPCLAVVMVLNGGLRGAGDTRWTLAITLVGLAGIRLPCAYLLTHIWHFGIEGAWWSMVIDIFIRCGLVVWRFRHGGWKTIEV